jgi:hypothetical protein
LLSRDALDERVRTKLVGSLYTQPSSLALGAIAGSFAAICAAIYSQEPVILGTAVLLVFTAVMRVGAAVYLGRNNEVRDVAKLELIYEIGAFSYAFLVGLMAALTIAYQVDRVVELLCVAYAIAYGTGIAARNAGRPVIAVGQMLLALSPLIVVSAAHGQFLFLVFAATVALLVPAMMSITFNVFNVLKESVAAAETSAKLAEKMQTLARTDVVTSLANRAGLNHELVEIMMARDPTSKLALFWLDLDRFKEVNDTLGHPVGDRVLAEVARRLKETAHSDAIVARFGGDEFIIARELDARADS